jgi:hypothetical protein
LICILLKLLSRFHGAAFHLQQSVETDGSVDEPALLAVLAAQRRIWPAPGDRHVRQSHHLLPS